MYNLRELALAYRRKYRMSCVHARVGSFGAITRVCEMGGEGRLLHLGSPSPNFDGFRWWVVGGGPPYFCKFLNEIPLKKIPQTSRSEIHEKQTFSLEVDS